MAIYKRYNTRKKRINRALLIWIGAILVIFTATAIFGYALGKRAEGAGSYLPTDTAAPSGGDTIEPLVERVMRAEYVAPTALAKFVHDDPFVYASTWLYKDGAVAFATEVERALGADVHKLPSLDAFSIDAGVSGMFAVRSLYAEENVREILFAYETALLCEYASTALREIVLVFERMDMSLAESAFSLADALSQKPVLCLPYAFLKEEFAPRFFTEATERGYTLALMADSSTKKTFATDIEDYAFFFTRYQLRLLLEGKDAALLDTMREKNLLSYQFISPRVGA